MARPSSTARTPAPRAGVLVAGCLLAMGALLTGCYEDTDVTVHDPGVYKGKTDPLLAKMKTESLQGELDDRFRSVQMDR